jgi:hypothetical protein
VAFQTDDELIAVMTKLGFEVSADDCRIFVQTGHEGKLIKGCKAYKVIESDGLLVAEEYSDS